MHCVAPIKTNMQLHASTRPNVEAVAPKRLRKESKNNPVARPIALYENGLKRKLREKNFKTKDDLKVEWLSLSNNIPERLIDKLISSILKRVQEVIKSRGGSINY